MTRADGGRPPAALNRHALFLALLLALPELAQAADITFEAGLSARHSDNVGLSEDAAVSETVVAPDVHFELEQSGTELQLIARGSAEYQHFVGGEYEDELRGNFIGHLDWTPFSERMKLVVEDYLSYQPVDVLATNTPDNLQRLNVFVAGPSFYFNPAAATQLSLDLRYARHHAERTEPFNGERGSAVASLQRELSPISHVTLHASSTANRFDDSEAFPGYTRNEGYLSYARNLRRLDLGVEVGRSWVNLDNGAALEEDLYRAVVDWRISSRSEFNLRYASQFSDTAGDIVTRAANLALDAPNVGSGSNVVVAPDLYRQKRYDLAYRYRGERASFAVEPSFEENRYVIDRLLDHELEGALVRFDLRLSSSTTLNFLASRMDRRFENIQREDEDVSGSVGLTQELSRHWSLRTDLTHRKRETNAQGLSFDENSIYVRLAYRR